MTAATSPTPTLDALCVGDPHRPGSADAVLLARRIPLTLDTRAALYAAPGPVPYRAGSRPELERFVRTALDGAEHGFAVAVALTRFCARIPRLFPTSERPTAGGFYGDFLSYLRGGTEEEVIKKGSPLSGERARVLCAMAQIAGLPARIVFLARTDPAERHAATEVFVTGQWWLFDGFSGRFYPRPKHGYASAWDIHRTPRIADGHPDHGRQRYVAGAYYGEAAIAAYDIVDFATYEYPWDLITPELAARLAQGLGA